MYKLLINSNEKLPKVAQITQALIRDIEKGLLKKDERLPSVSNFSKQYKISRDTVEKAYNRLKDDGYLVAVPGKGNYVAGRSQTTLRILMLLNKLSSYKKEVYDAFVKKLGKNAKVDLHIYHYDPKLLKEFLDANRGKYHYYAIMPHFFHDADVKEILDILTSIPEHELVILDKKFSIGNGNHISVYQDFEQDIYDALKSATELFEKYKSISIVFPELSNHPIEITEGVRRFCDENRLKFSIVANTQDMKLKQGHVYITLIEADLADLIKKVRVLGLQMGEDIGIISFNETVLKELLDITVITTDFEEMGDTAATLILEKKFQQVRNSFRLIKRLSL